MTTNGTSGTLSLDLEKHTPPIVPQSSSTLVSVSAELHARVSAFLSTPYTDEALRSTQSQVRKSLGIIREALRKYPLESLSLSYNGGKDCLVLLLLFLSALHNHPSTTPLPSRLQSIYIISPHPFAEVDTFVTSSAATYALDLHWSTLRMRQAFERYLSYEGKNVKAIFVGTRRTDPHGAGLRDFQRTDGGWPDFVRVLPVLEWRLRDVWSFIREMKVDYCPLYNQGFTSLGGTTDTVPNPVLKVVDSDGRVRYRPAYELENDADERLGRD
ncbi:MAG: 3'-phosphoadenosine 5'-phosphosulfate sulfotransferase [Vezdaea aestivalis]|nr:MAG: 3'-phosphoadenosine 5'-phosphosulfate sulfotransferase [Vezdaea aestivalis]